MAPDLSSRLHGGECPPDPLERERVQGHVGAQPQHLESGVEVYRTLQQAGRKIRVLVLGGSGKDYVAERSVQRADRGKAPGKNDRRRNPANSAQVDVRLPEPEVGESEATVARCAYSPFTRESGQRIPRNARISECPLQTDIQRVEKA